VFSVLTTNQKGAVAEAAITLEAVKLGIGVYAPCGAERCDLIFDLRPRLVRVQCKSATTRNDVIVIPLFSSRRAAEGLRRTAYSAQEVDAFAAYSPETARCYFCEFAEVGHLLYVNLRLNPAKNNQLTGIRWARDYEFAATIGRPGAVAQLGEHLHGMQKARGSSPLRSTP
jgi:PD-(D/E)XK endonuclease